MTRSHREIFSSVVVIIVLHIYVAVSMNCNSTLKHVPFCSGKSISGREVYLSGLDNKTNGIGCNCSISLIQYKQDPVTIEIKNVTTTSNLCDYKLFSVHQNISKRMYSCGENLDTGSEYYLRSMETVILHMELRTNNNVGFPFCLQIYSTQVDSRIKLQCTPKSTTATASPTPVPHMKSTSANHSMSTIANTNNIPTSSTFGNGDTSATHSTPLNPGTGGDNGTSYTTVKSNTSRPSVLPSTTEQQPNTDDSSYTTVTSNTSSVIPSTTEQQPNDYDSNRLIGTVIGSIVGVLVVVALVIIVVCLVKRRQKKLPYETLLEPQYRPHNLNAVVTPNNNANGYNSQITNPGNQGMIYLENDLYKSIDDDEPVVRRGGNHEGMIYLENDLYISSNETDDVNQDAENSVPHQPVEYAVVNKTAKKSSSSNGASMGHTVGPGGDEYTLVQKK